MEGLGILRLLVLFCLLAIGFHGRVVNAGQDATVVEPSTTPRTCPRPSTVRDLLDVLVKLNKSGIKAQITREVQDRVKVYLKPPGILGIGIKWNLTRLLRGVTELRNVLLKNPKQYGQFSDFVPSDGSIACYADILVQWLPVLHSELWFLYYQTDKRCIQFAGGWRVFQRFGMSYYTTQLHRWFTDQLDRKNVPYIPKGFHSHELHDGNVGAHIAMRTGIYYHKGGRLNYAQYGLMFLSPTWHDANLASAVLFLQEFCSELQAKKFDEYNYHVDFDRAKPACAAFTMNLKSLTDELHPLYSGSTDKNPYKGKLKPKAYSKYVDWLGQNLAGIIDALRRMSSRMSRWTESILYNSEYSGPFRYGFVFKDGWEGGIKVTLPPVLTEMTHPLSTLLVSVLQPTTAPSRPAQIPSQTVHLQPLLANQPPTIAGTYTLRDLLDILDILSVAGVKTTVLQNVQTTLQFCIKTNEIPDETIEHNLNWVLGKIPLLRRKLLKDPDQYGQYSDFNPDEDSVDYFVEAVSHWLPVLHSELWFLYYHTAEECVSIGGGGWRNQNFGKSNGTTQLHRWLVSKGFRPDDLHESNVGSDIATRTDIELAKGSRLSYAQYGLFLLSPTWHDSNLGSAVLFLQEFCREVTEKKLDSHAPGSIIETLKSACETVKENLKSLTDELHPLYSGSTDKNPYKGMLKPKAYYMYVDWLGQNLSGIIDALRRMSSRMSRWTMAMLYNFEFYGPFRYGFVFKDKTWETTIKSKLPPVLTEMTQSLSTLLVSVFQLTTAPSRPAQIPSQTVHLQPPLSNQPPTIAGTYTLRDLLDILDILSVAGVRKQVAKEVQHKVQVLLDVAGIPGDSVEGVITTLIGYAPELREQLLKDPTKFGKFSRFNPDEDSIAYYVDILIKWLPVLHSELWFLYFQTTEECISIGGGGWRNQNFGKSNGTTQFHRWLVSKGFRPDDLHESNRGSDVAARTGIYFNEGGVLNYAQYGLFLLNPTWHHSNLGSAVLFLQEFCSEVQGSRFSSHMSANNTDALTSVCEVLSMGFAFLTDTLHPLYDGSMDTYRGKLRPEYLGTYVDWLGRNLGSLKEALGQMLSEASLWTSDMFNKASLPGPFRYGFVFKDPKWERSIQVKQPTVLFSLTGQASTPTSGIRQCRNPKASA